MQALCKPCESCGSSRWDAMKFECVVIVPDSACHVCVVVVLKPRRLLGRQSLSTGLFLTIRVGTRHDLVHFGAFDAFW